MKLIDEKCKFFGKINLIDLLVLFIIIFLVTAVFYKILSPRISTSQTAQSEVTAMVKCTFKTESVAKSIEIGQKLVYGTEYIDASIADVSYYPSDYITTDAQGNIRLLKHPYLVDVLITIKAKVNKNAAILKVGTQELCLGKKFTIKTHSLEIDGSVESISANK